MYEAGAAITGMRTRATGEDARLIEYSYTAEFDRQFQLAAATADVPEQQRDFEQLQRARNKR